MKAVDFFKTKFADDFEDYGDVTIPDMIEILRHKYTHNNSRPTGGHVKRQRNATGHDSDNLSRHVLLSLCRGKEKVQVELSQRVTNVNVTDTYGADGGTNTYRNIEGVNTSGANSVNDTGYNGDVTTLRTKYVLKRHRSESEDVFEIAHILHYCSIAILGVFVIQVGPSVYVIVVFILISLISLISL